MAWRLRRDPNFTVLIISAKRDLAKRNASFIRSLISDSILTEDLPPKNDELWQKQTFTVKRTMIGLEPSVQVTSLESDYVGKHAQLVIIDDGETADTTRTHQSREWLKQKMRDELLPGRVLPDLHRGRGGNPDIHVA